MPQPLRLAILLAAFALPAAAEEAVPSAAEIEAATYEGGELPEGQSALTVKLQVLLDRAHISPGVIDGYKGGMTATALRAFEVREGFEVDGLLDAEVWAALGGPDAAGIVIDYTITEEDAAGLSAAPLPEDYAELAELDWIGFTSVAERLAERFHMDEDFLIALNPGAGFAPGETITVVDPGEPASGEVAEIRIDAATGRLVARAEDGTVIADYPVTVGSRSLPTPEGSFEVVAIAPEPNYTYDPDLNFQQGDNTETLVLPPGPNGPVGIVWIDLSEPTYGIHGTAEPAKLFQEVSHGCVRMTNWDAEELMEMVRQGTKVEIVQ